MTRFRVIGSGAGPAGVGPEDPMLEARVARLEEDMKEVKSTLKSIEARLGSIELTLAKMDGRISGLEGRIVGLDAKVGSLPTTWTILGIVFTTWALGSGVLIFALNFLQP